MVKLKNRNWLIFCLITNILLLTLCIYLLANVHIVFGIIMFIPIIIFGILSFVFFSKFTNQYPLNAPVDYALDVHCIELKYITNKECIIEIKEDQKGIWQIELTDGKLVFDLRKYFFPRTYICTFFIRHLNYLVVNKQKLRLHKLFTSLQIDKEKFATQIELEFQSRTNIKKLKVVKDGKTKVGFLRSMILQSRYYLDVVFGPRGGSRMSKFEKVNEENYLAEITSKEEKPSITKQ